MYWLLFLWQKLGRSWWRIWRKKMNKQHFFASFSQSTAPPLPELVPADSRRADQDQGTLLVWLQSESQRSVKKCWMKRGYSHWMCCHLVWYDIYALVQIKRWKCSKQIIKPVEKECWTKHSVICELEIYANRRDLTCCLSCRQYLRSQIMTKIECKSPAKYVHHLDNMWKLAWKC